MDGQKVSIICQIPYTHFLNFLIVSMFETILGAIFILGLFLFTAYGLPKMGYRIRGKRIYRDFETVKHVKNLQIDQNKLRSNGCIFYITKTLEYSGDSKCLCHCHSGRGGCFGMVVDGKEYSHVYCVEKCVHCI